MRTNFHKLVLLVLATMAAWVFFGQDQFVRLRFQEITGSSVLSVMTPLVVLALFLERAVEVFISIAREAGRDRLRTEATVAKEAAEADPESAEKAEIAQAAANTLQDYKMVSKSHAFYAGLIGGSLIAVVGVRCLWPLVEQSSLIPDSTQFALFNLVDVALTAGLLAGGSEGLHQLVSVVTDKIKTMRSS